MAEGIRLYNLLTRLAGPVERWTEHARRAAAMGFNAVYVNPFHYPGFSGSLYAPKDYYRVNPVFLQDPSENGMDHVRRFVEQAHALGLRVVMDLVINHTAIDSDLVSLHPEWYARGDDGRVKNPSAIDPADARNVTVWGDLAEIDNEHSPDREGLWEYWRELVLYFLRMGFDGFRCDAAYQVCSPLWRDLFARARGERDDVFFIAETLGCREADIARLAGDGFDYLYNSSKWWNFTDDWCLRQYDLGRRHAPSLSFAETHDTERLAAESGGDDRVSRLRFLFSAVFSKGLLMPLGFEYGFRKRFSVVETRPEDWETPLFDLSPWIARVNALKARTRVFNEEGPIAPVRQGDPAARIFRKTSLDGAQTALFLLNPDCGRGARVEIGSLARLLETREPLCDVTPDHSRARAVEGDSLVCDLAPGQMRVLVAGT